MIPSQLSETNFRRFEPILLQAQQAYPLPIKFEVPGLASTTAAARCRDALLAFKRNLYAAQPWSTRLDKTIAQDLAVYVNSEGLWLGKHKPTNTPRRTALVVEADLSGVWTREEYSALCLLIQNQRIEGGLIVPHIDQPTQLFLESTYNIAITSNPDGTSLIV